ncbi:MAG: hypothetical protein KAR11_08565 [Phycisphaerae bacterium]|nr:hypothetical protein [Phycisphaerae bacterium]
MDDSNLTAAVSEALKNRKFLAELQKNLDEADLAVAKLQPVCKACGKCCNFAQAPHRLYASTGEIALLVAKNPPTTAPPLTCPYQQQDACENRKPRPLGCRTFFCEQHQQKPVTSLLQDVYEKSHAKITQLHAKYQIPYQYRELTQACGELNSCE